MAQREILLPSFFTIFYHHLSLHCLWGNYSEQYHYLLENTPTEEALRESEGIMRSILANSPDYIIMMDKEGLIQFINRPLPGMKLSDFQYKNILSTISSEYHEIMKDRISQLFKRGKARSVKFKIQNPSGFSAVYEARFGALKREWEIYGLIMIFTDISDRDKIETELRENENKFRNVVENLHEGFVIYDENIRITYLNNKICELSGFKREEVLNESFAKFLGFLPDEGKIMESLKRRKIGIEDSYEIIFSGKDGITHHVLVSGTPIFDSDGKYKGGFALLTDIDERVRTEEKLRESEKMYLNLVEKSDDLIALLDLQGNIIYANKAFLDATFFTEEEVLGTNGLNYIHPDDVTRAISELTKIGDGKKIIGFNYRVKTKGNEIVTISSNGTPIFDKNGNIIQILSVGRMITEQ